MAIYIGDNMPAVGCEARRMGPLRAQHGTALCAGRQDGAALRAGRHDRAALRVAALRAAAEAEAALALAAELEEARKNNNAWYRLQQGMQMTPVSNKRVSAQLKWFLEHPG